MPRLSQRLIGFYVIEEYLEPENRCLDMEKDRLIQAVSLKRLLSATLELIKKNRWHCSAMWSDCEMCNSVRGRG